MAGGYQNPTAHRLRRGPAIEAHEPPAPAVGAHDDAGEITTTPLLSGRAGRAPGCACS